MVCHYKFKRHAALITYCITDYYIKLYTYRQEV